METNVHIISMHPKHHTELIRTWTGSYFMMYFIDNKYIFSFYPENIKILFKNNEYRHLISEILENDIIGVYVNHSYHAKLDNVEKIKELINNHTLSDEEKIVFRDFI